MKLARVRTRGVLRPASPFLIVAAALVVVLAACGAATGTPSPGSSTIGSPVETATASTSVGPDVTPTETSTDEPGVPDSGGLPTPFPTLPVGGVDAAAAACYGSAKTKDFFVAIAEAVDWPVYCAVLPIGWSVEAGSYHLANGGQMVISYKTAAGAHLQLQEGHWCTDGASACSPHDVSLGPASFGDQQGEIGTLGDSLVLYVSAGEDPSWTATGTGLDVETFRQLCAGLAHVGA